METLLKTDDRKMNSKINDVVCFYLESNFIKVSYYNGEESIIENDFIGIIHKLPQNKFFQVNESTIINADYIKKIRYCNPKKVLLQKGLELNILHNKYDELIEFMKKKYEIA